MTDDWKGEHLIRSPRSRERPSIVGQGQPRDKIAEARERDQARIAELAAKGLTRREIAERTGIAVGRVYEIAKTFKIDIVPGYSRGHHKPKEHHV